MRQWALYQWRQCQPEGDAHDETELEWAAAVTPCICFKDPVPAVVLTMSPKQMRKVSLHWSWLIALPPEGSSGAFSKQACPHH